MGIIMAARLVKYGGCARHSTFDSAVQLNITSFCDYIEFKRCSIYTNEKFRQCTEIVISNLYNILWVFYSRAKNKFGI